jgi:hypothetical protein
MRDLKHMKKYLRLHPGERYVKYGLINKYRYMGFPSGALHSDERWFIKSLIGVIL